MRTNHQKNQNLSVAGYIFKQRNLLIILAVIFNTANSRAQLKTDNLSGKWHLEMEHNDLGLSQIIMEFNVTGENNFEGHTRKDALKDILGGAKSMLAKSFNDGLKGGSILRIENGTYSSVSDSLKFTGVLTSLVGNYNIKGYVFQGKLSATLNDMNNNYKGSIKGERNTHLLPLRDYHALYKETASLTYNKIFNRDIMQTKEWKRFDRKMNDVSAKVQDDLEMVFAFFYYAGKLPISHYMLMRPFGDDETEQSHDTEVATGVSENYKQRVFLEEKGAGVGYLKITSFDGSAAEMDSVFKVIAKNNYKNLIVDLRNNPGGSVDAGMSFATHVADNTFYGGVFLTQKYFNNHDELPTVAEYESFPHFTESNYDMLMHGIHTTEGLCLKVVPKEPVYDGKLYILINGRTGSTCEPLVYGFKQKKRAVIIGKPTAGAMLAAEMFELSDGFRMFLPTADYYSFDGQRLDKIGVKPDVEVEGDALEYVMRLIAE
ncbi:hypothetical protein Q763_00010 [Flavobacterium beibuense F44-8]|uniref:Tail specific protease domain-containing protein n=1 Tax=Flavobacterium beibuense F44-8 TaxID=1406840 RepID=A0A0A2M7C5_9FLAO|nr:S41 family peptidase [Flavobacterium beibuense]KGO84165.1 hypothetical protein Q763_00010 [Flavobacterium beibuense F44-8]